MAALPAVWCAFLLTRPSKLLVKGVPFEYHWGTGFWATVALNIPDFTRYAKSQRDQAIGQLIGQVTGMVEADLRVRQQPRQSADQRDRVEVGNRPNSQGAQKLGRRHRSNYMAARRHRPAGACRRDSL